MTSFDVAMARLLPHEGGYSSDAGDAGNWTGGRVGQGKLLGTKFGIAANTYPDLDIKNLTWEQAKGIYRRDFWEKIGGDRLKGAAGYVVLDAAINSGIGQATRWVQRAVGAKQDGIMGPATRAAIDATDPNDIAFRVMGFRLQFMTELATWPRYGKGWARRIAAGLLYAADDN
jgi:lysozyme family protein